jgi:hypothetical protein
MSGSERRGPGQVGPPVPRGAAGSVGQSCTDAEAGDVDGERCRCRLWCICHGASPPGTRRHKDIGGWPPSAGLVSAWGETDASTNRYHEQASPSKLAAGAQTDQTHGPVHRRPPRSGTRRWVQATRRTAPNINPQKATPWGPWHPAGPPHAAPGLLVPCGTPACRSHDPSTQHPRPLLLLLAGGGRSAWCGPTTCAATRASRRCTTSAIPPSPRTPPRPALAPPTGHGQPAHSSPSASCVGLPRFDGQG